MISVRTCLWFDGRIEEAARFYVDLIPDSAIESQVDYPEGHTFPGGMSGPLIVDLTIGGAPFQLLTGGPQFPQTEAASIVVTVDDQAEVDRIWDALTADGGAEAPCGWCRDRFGVSWQIVPRGLAALMEGPNAGAVARELQTMRRIDLSRLEAAAAG